MFNFDVAVRKIAPADKARNIYNAVLEANRTTIADLDAIASARSLAEVGRLLRTRVVPDATTLDTGEKKLYEAL